MDDDDDDDDDGSPKHPVLFTMLHLLHKNGAFQFAQVISFSCVISACARCGEWLQAIELLLGQPDKRMALAFGQSKLREKNGRSRDFVPTKMAIYIYIYICIDIACCYLYE